MQKYCSVMNVAYTSEHFEYNKAIVKGARYRNVTGLFYTCHIFLWHYCRILNRSRARTRKDVLFVVKFSFSLISNT